MLKAAILARYGIGYVEANPHPVDDEGKRLYPEPKPLYIGNLDMDLDGFAQWAASQCMSAERRAHILAVHNS